MSKESNSQFYLSISRRALHSKFTLLDPHHLLTNARTKSCGSGIPERSLAKDAWIRVAKGGIAGLNVALDEDLICRQSDSFARLLDSVRFNQFPPPGSQIRGIPLVMFEGLMTNIEQRNQLFTFVKKGAFHFRALGSL